MRQRSDSQKEECLRRHLRHRLTLLRTLQERKSAAYAYAQQGDIYRCVKDSNLIAVRLLMDFVGLGAEAAASGPELRCRQRGSGPKYADDVKIDQFIGRLLSPADVPPAHRRTLAGVYLRADKELAHLTTLFNEEFNHEDSLIDAATAIEQLLERYLYAPSGEPLPPIDA